MERRDYKKSKTLSKYTTKDNKSKKREKKRKEELEIEEIKRKNREIALKM